MLVLFILFMSDFILTYFGISLGIITEGNALLIWLFQVPFIVGLIIRFLMFLGLIYMPIKFIKKGKIRPLISKAFYGIAFTANIGVLCMHLYWIVLYKGII